jgi:hypothetical protein
MSRVAKGERMSYSTLLGSVNRRWTDVLAPVIFLMHRGRDLMPIMRLHKANGFATVLKEPGVAAALAQVAPGEEFATFLDQHIETGAASEWRRLNTSVFHSALVFGHAILDDALNEALRIGFALQPSFFYDKVKDRKVPVSRLREADSQAVINECVHAWLTAQERDSILSKFKVLCSLTKPADPREIIQDYAFDLERIEQIDELRHSVVHKTPLRAVSYGDLEYLRLSTNFAVGLLTEIGAQADPIELFRELGVDVSSLLTQQRNERGIGTTPP